MTPMPGMMEANAPADGRPEIVGADVVVPAYVHHHAATQTHAADVVPVPAGTVPLPLPPAMPQGTPPSVPAPVRPTMCPSRAPSVHVHLYPAP